MLCGSLQNLGVAKLVGNMSVTLSKAKGLRRKARRTQHV